MAGSRGICQKYAHLTVLELSQTAAPLPLHAAGIVSLLGKAAGVEHQNRLGISEFLPHVLADLRHHSLVVPGSGTHEVLHGFAVQPSLVGDRLAGLAFQTAEPPLEHHLGVVTLLLAVKQREVTL